jgi:flagellar motility protein MotE (MotC chaperone)
LEQQIEKTKETIRDLQNSYDKLRQQAALPENQNNSELQERVKTLETSLKNEKKQLVTFVKFS